MIRLFIAAALGIGLANPVFAQEAPVAAAPVVIVASPAPEPNQEGLVSLDFQDADIRNVLKVLSYKSGVNIVTGPEVNGLVTIQLTDVPWLKALEVILATYGYSYERHDNIITVTTVENLKKRREDTKVLEDQEPLYTKTYSLSFAKASEVVESISKIKSPRGSINFDQRTNTVIVRDVQRSVDLIDNVVKTLDSVTPQVLIEAKVIETTLNDRETLGIDWTTQFTGNNKGTNNLQLATTSTTNTVTVNAAGPTSSVFSYGTLDAATLQAVLRLLDRRTDTHILSNPRIVTLDNQPAKIHVGTEYPIPEYTYNTEQAKLQVSGWEFKKIGILFEVTPHVNNAGLVTLDLHPSITAISGEATVESTTLPLLSVEEANTKVMIENGQTLVIAGLIKNSTSKVRNKVPFLGDIPFIGKAFRHKDDTDEKTEILIFLTPHIITAGTSTFAAQAAAAQEASVPATAKSPAPSDK
jgi:type IV pilus assembly protein PilQ